MGEFIQVALLEDHPVFRAGVKMALAPDFHVCLEESHGREFLSKVEEAQPEVVLLDLILPDMPGTDVAKELRQRYADTIKILVVSIDSSKDTLEKLLAVGIEGFLSKDAAEEELLQAVKTIAAGGTYYAHSTEMLEREIMIAARNGGHETLTDRESEIMLALCQGLSSAQIADKMFISPKTVDNHKQHIFAKLGIHNVLQLINYALQHKIITI